MIEELKNFPPGDKIPEGATSGPPDNFSSDNPGNRSARDGNDGGGAIRSNSINTFPQKHAEEALSEYESRLRALFEAMNDLVIVLDTHGRCLEVAPTSPSLLYLPSSDQVGKTIFEVFPEDPAEDILEKIRITKETNQKVRFEYKIPVGGNDLYFSATLSPLTPDTVLLFARDISGFKHAELYITRANRVYALISQINQMVIRTRQQDKIFSEACRIAVNHGGFRMAWIGLLDESLGRVVPLAWDGFEEGYLSAIKQISLTDESLSQGPTGQAIIHGKYYCCNDIENDPRMRLWKQDALRRGYRSSIALPLIIKNQVIGAFSIYASEPFFFNESEIQLLEEVTDNIAYALDISELENKQREMVKALSNSEENYRTLVEHASDGIFIADPNGNYVEVNRNGCLMLGYSREELLKLNIRDLIPAENLATQPILLDEIKKGKTVINERNLICKDGSLLPVEISGKVLADGRYQGIVRDITERKRAEEALNQKMQELESFNKITVDRELRMIELKKEVNALLRQAGLEEKYKIVE